MKSPESRWQSNHDKISKWRSHWHPFNLC